MSKVVVTAMCCIAIALIGFAAAYFSNKFLPYSMEHYRQIYAMQLASMINAWQKAGGKPSDLETTNSSVKVYLLRTNVVWNGQAFLPFVALEAKNFRGKGLLTGTTNLDVLWVDSKGAVSLKMDGGKPYRAP